MHLLAMLLIAFYTLARQLAQRRCHPTSPKKPSRPQEPLAIYAPKTAGRTNAQLGSAMPPITGQLASAACIQNGRFGSVIVFER